MIQLQTCFFFNVFPMFSGAFLSLILYSWIFQFILLLTLVGFLNTAACNHCLATLTCESLSWPWNTLSVVGFLIIEQRCDRISSRGNAWGYNWDGNRGQTSWLHRQTVCVALAKVTRCCVSRWEVEKPPLEKKAKTDVAQTKAAVSTMIKEGEVLQG